MSEEHRYGFIVVLETKNEDIPKIILEHDRRIGAFIRHLGTAETLLSQLFSTISGVDPRAASFLLSKYGAGQKIALLQSMQKEMKEGEVKLEIKSICSRYQSINEFRNLIAHHGIAVVRGNPTLIKQGAKLEKYMGTEEDIGEGALKKKLDDIIGVTTSISAVLRAFAGDERPLKEILAELET